MVAAALLVQDEPLVLLGHRDELVDRPELDDGHDLAHVDRVDVEHAAAETARDRAGDIWDGGIVTEIVPLGEFHRAEEYHQDFFAKNPNQGYCLAVALPKVNKVRKSYAEYVLAS